MSLCQGKCSTGVSVVIIPGRVLLLSLYQGECTRGVNVVHMSGRVDTGGNVVIM